ncbi:MAG: hypothetical protein AAF850_00460 [Pseudomonadota bacterium]
MTAEQKPKLLIYSQTNDRTISNNMGKPEYSYYYILKSYLPILRALGEIETVYEPETEVDKIYHECIERGQQCLFLHFSAMQNFIEGIRCPTIHILAWEYSTIPSEPWDNNPYNDWRDGLSRSIGAISISGYTADIITDTMGDSYPAGVAPCPVWDNFESFRKANLQSAPFKKSHLTFDGVVIDSRLIDMTVKLPTAEERDLKKRRGDLLMFLMEEKNRRLNEELSGINETRAALFREIQDEWRHINASVDAEWRRIEAERALIASNREPPIVNEALRHHVASKKVSAKTLKGRIRLIVNAIRYTIAEIRFALFGGEPGVIRPPLTPQPKKPRKNKLKDDKYALKEQEAEKLAQAAALEEPTPFPEAEGVTRDDFPGSEVEEAGLTDTSELVQARDLTTLKLEGYVYTAILNPYDGRKNWQDMLVAFCWAFREVKEATLVLKITAAHIVQFSDQLVFYLKRLSPMKCRVVVIHAFLDDNTYTELLKATTYYVNTSYGEGQSIPLCEAMSGGIPAVAPNHTAMRDYVFDDAAFVFATELDPTNWQHDERRAFRCLQNKPNWLSLVQAFRDSLETARSDPARYRAMGEAAIRRTEAHCSTARVQGQLSEFFDPFFTDFANAATPWRELYKNSESHVSSA